MRYLLLVFATLAALWSADRPLEVQSAAGQPQPIQAGDNGMIRDGANIVLGTGTGTKWGTATSQKQAWYNATPIIQQTGDVATALAAYGLVTSPTVVATTAIDGTFRVLGSGDATKKAAWEVDGQATGSVLTWDAGAQTTSRTLTAPVLAGNDTLVSLATATPFTGLVSVTNSGALIHRQASTQDGMAIQGRAGGTSSYSVTHVPTTLTASRTVTWPDLTGIPALSASALTANTVVKGTTGGAVADSTITDTGSLITFGSDTTQATNWAQTGAKTVSTGTGAVSLNGPTSVLGATSTFTATAFAPTITSGSAIAGRFTCTATPSGASSANFYATYGNIATSGANNFTAATAGVVGIQAFLDHFGSGTLVDGHAGRFVALLRVGGGNVTTLQGVGAQAGNVGAGTITDAVCVNAVAGVNSGGGAVTRMTGVASVRQTVGATNVGFFYGALASITVGNWGFYNQTADPNFLGTGQTSSGSTTDATSTTTGSFTTLGGVSMAKALWVGGLSNIAGVLTVANTTEASAVGTASTVVTGGLGVAKRSYLGTIGSTFKGNVDAGVQDATAAVAGQVGEVITSSVTGYTNYTTTATIQQLATISLTPGDWMEYATVTYYGNGATNATDGEFVSYLCDTTASATGAVEGETLVYQDQPVTGTLHRTVTISFHEVISASKSKYLNGKAAFTVGNPQYTCSLKAVRIR